MNVFEMYKIYFVQYKCFTAIFDLFNEYQVLFDLKKVLSIIHIR